MNFVLKVGATGQEAARMMTSLGFSGQSVFTPIGKSRLSLFQAGRALNPDGVYGPASQAAMDNQIYRGIDVSDNNGDVDWKKVAKTQKFAFVKMTEGRTFKAKSAAFNYKSAKDAGIIVGGYHYARPDTDYCRTAPEMDAVVEARAFIERLKLCGWDVGDLIPCLDLEEGIKTDDEYNAKWALHFLERVKKELGVTPIIYTAKWAMDLYLRDISTELFDRIVQYPAWLADYTTNFNKDPKAASEFDRWDIWQWTGSGKVDGVVGKVDMNWLPGGEIGLAKLRHKSC